MENISIGGAAQRLGTPVERIRELIKEGNLVSPRKDMVTLDSVYAYSGLKPEGKQTQKKHVGRPRKGTVEEAQKPTVRKSLTVEESEDKLDDVVEKMTVEWPDQDKEDVTDTHVGDIGENKEAWTDEQMRNSVEIAYLKGKLSVYEEVYKLERRNV